MLTSGNARHPPEAPSVIPSSVIPSEAWGSLSINSSMLLSRAEMRRADPPLAETSSDFADWTTSLQIATALWPRNDVKGFASQ